MCKDNTDVNDRAIRNIMLSDRQAVLDLMQFNRMPHVNRIKYDEGFTPPADHEQWVERQIVKAKSDSPPSVRTTIKEALEELTEERALFNRLDSVVDLTNEANVK